MSPCPCAIRVRCLQQISFQFVVLCRPLSKTIRFNALQVNPKSTKQAQQMKEFAKF